MKFIADVDEARRRALFAGRSLAGLDQKQFAKLLKWTPQKLSAFENGAHASSKTWLEIRRVLAKQGVKIAVMGSQGHVNISGSFVKPEVDDDEEELD